MWKLVDVSDADRKAAIRRFSDELTALVGVVPGLVRVTVTADVRDAEGNFDVALVSIHENREALATYQSHPDHVLIGTWWGKLVAQRAAVDSEL